MLTMIVIDPYTKIHKALRRDMFACLTTLGSLDLADAEALASARERVSRLLRDLAAHAEHEDEFLGPVLHDHMPEHAALLAGQHHELERRLTLLERRFAGERFGDPEALLAGYRELAEFVAAYLEHLAAEERALPEFARVIPHERLAAAMAAFGASRSPDQREYALRQMLPALSRAERVELLQGFVAAPEPAASAARSIARSVLDERDWSALERDLVVSRR
ncbi:hemerythrin domain-containing protein [Nannocystaceae bacterium ST9]